MANTKNAKARLQKLIETRTKNQEAYKRRKLENGYVRVMVWVPKERADELKTMARAMCNTKRKKDVPFGSPVVSVSGKPTGWSYLKAERHEVVLHMVLKDHGAQWQNAKKKHPNTWRIRSDVVKKLGLESRVVFEEDAKKPALKKKTAKKVSKGAKGK